jgi:hypothetical protein
MTSRADGNAKIRLVIPEAVLWVKEDCEHSPERGKKLPFFLSPYDQPDVPMSTSLNTKITVSKLVKSASPNAFHSPLLQGKAGTVPPTAQS